VELHADAPDGQLLGTVEIPAGGKAGFSTAKMPFQFTGDRPRKIFAVVRRNEGESKMMALSGMKFQVQ
jgi:hypothetical protein